ncbi:MAG: hypothetical protein PHT40_01825 [Patescibacteria group bacterium]|nr:hypothetical protein [Patescibacteria group bacterium]
MPKKKESKEKEPKIKILNPEEMKQCNDDAVYSVEGLKVMIEETEKLLEEEGDPEIIEKLRDELEDLKKHYEEVEILADFFKEEEVEEITQKGNE